MLGSDLREGRTLVARPRTGRGGGGESVDEAGADGGNCCADNHEGGKEAERGDEDSRE